MGETMARLNRFAPIGIPQHEGNWGQCRLTEGKLGSVSINRNWG